jgi:serine protease Do
MFLARIVDSDETTDLALLELTGDVYGRPLPTSLRLPYVRLGDSSKLSLGEHVTVFGYPEAGSEHCRTGVIVSRGIVAGLEADRQGPVWVKTDAWIANGHSGGALVDSEGRLVGIPTATLGDRRSLGLVRPVSRVPERWKAMIRKGLEPQSK